MSIMRYNLLIAYLYEITLTAVDKIYAYLFYLFFVFIAFVTR